MAVNSNEKPSLIRHPFTPFVAALWFAALLGLGSLAVRATVLENAVLALGLDRLIPAAAPPLGFTARLLLALGLAVTGAALGYALTRRLAGPGRRAQKAVETFDASALAAADAAASIAAAGENDDLDRLEAARQQTVRAAPAGRRRALTNESSLGTEQPQILHLGELDSLGLEDEAPAPSALVDAEIAPDSAPAAPVMPQAALDWPAATTPVPVAPVAAAPNGAKALESLGIAELVERFTQALAARRAAAPATSPVTAVAPAPEQLFTAPAHAPAPQAVRDEPQPESMPAAIRAETPQSAPSVVYEEPAAPAPTRPFDMPAVLRQPGTIEWFDDEDGEDEEAAAATLDSLLPPKRPAGDPFRNLPESPEPEAADIAADAARWALPDPDENPEDELLDVDAAEEPADEPFSSLLDMKHSARVPTPPAAPFVRVEDGVGSDLPEPVVTFPGQVVPPAPIPARLPGAPYGATPVQTEAALRDALAALQKMSGAA